MTYFHIGNIGSVVKALLRVGRLEKSTLIPSAI